MRQLAIVKIRRVQMLALTGAFFAFIPEAGYFFNGFIQSEFLESVGAVSKGHGWFLIVLSYILENLDTIFILAN